MHDPREFEIKSLLLPFMKNKIYRNLAFVPVLEDCKKKNLIVLQSEMLYKVITYLWNGKKRGISQLQISFKPNKIASLFNLVFDV